jgi:hypothetical protein
MAAIIKTTAIPSPKKAYQGVLKLIVLVCKSPEYASTGYVVVQYPHNIDILFKWDSRNPV